jgi:hypothetical protein
MARVMLLLLVIAIAVLAALAVMVALRFAGPGPAQGNEDRMTSTFRMIAYVMLLALMIGVATGWLGPV